MASAAANFGSPRGDFRILEEGNNAVSVDATAGAGGFEKEEAQIVSICLIHPISRNIFWSEYSSLFQRFRWDFFIFLAFLVPNWSGMTKFATIPSNEKDILRNSRTENMIYAGFRVCT